MSALIQILPRSINICTPIFIALRRVTWAVKLVRYGRAMSRVCEDNASAVAQQKKQPQLNLCVAEQTLTV